MKSIKEIIFFALASVVLIGCSDKNTYQLSGQLENCDECTLYLMEMENNGINALDTIRANAKGKFKATEELTEESIFVLQAQNDYIMLCPKTKEKIIVNGDYLNLASTYTVSGSEQSSKLKILSDEQTKTRFTLKMMSDNLAQTDIDNIDSVKREVAKVYKSLREQQRNFLVNFIQSNQGSLTTLVALYRNMEGRPLISFTDDADIYMNVLSGLKKTYPTNKNTKNLEEFINHLKAVRQNQSINQTNHPAQ